MKCFIGNKNWNIVKEYNFDKLLYLLIDRPNRINSLNNFIWENNINNFHKNYNLPSYTMYKTAIWCLDDFQYRIVES